MTEVQAFEAAGVDLVGVGVNAAGETVVVTSGGNVDTAEGQDAVEEFASARGETDEVATIELQGPVEAVVSRDLVGGSGYISHNTTTNEAGYCSLGFAAWSPTREPAFITAGHCVNDPGKNVALATIPEEEPAVGGPGTLPSSALASIGTFGFSQFGGPAGSNGAENDPDSIDIAVIDVDENAGWVLKPEVTDWTTAGATPSSLAESTTSVEQVGLPQVGPIARSGRTTGHQVGTVRAGDILDGWIRVSGYWVHGFSSETLAIPGDSGGSVVQGTTAVGVVSGSATDNAGNPFMWASLLQDSLPATGGYEVALDIDSPRINSEDVATGDGIAVALPDNATGLSVSVGDQETTVTPVNGSATIPTPAAGVFDYTLTATNGMSRSEPIVETVTVAPIAPAMTSIGDGASFANDEAPTSLSGTGVEGAVVEVTLTTQATAGTEADLTADLAAPAPAPAVSNYTATVRGGTWSVDLKPFGTKQISVNVSAVQIAQSIPSAASSLSFTVLAQAAAPPVDPAPVDPAPASPTPAQQPLANTGSATLAPMGLTASAALLLGALLLGAAAIRRRNQATR